MSYGKRVSSISWDDYRSCDNKKEFDAEYIFDDGFDSIDEIKAALPEPEKYVYVRFCDQWYAVNGRGRSFWLVVAADKCYECSSGIIRIFPLAAYSFPKIHYHDAGRSRWREGVFLDLVRIDPDIEVQSADGQPAGDLTEASNTIIMFGSLFFTGELLVGSDGILNNVLPYYYGGDDLDKKWAEADRLRRSMVYSWNPFTGECSHSEAVRDNRKRIKAEEALLDQDD